MSVRHDKTNWFNNGIMPAQKAILGLRNPDDSSAKFTVDARAAFQLPLDATEAITYFDQWKNTNDNSSVTLQPGKTRTLTLKPSLPPRRLALLQSKQVRSSRLTRTKRPKRTSKNVVAGSYVGCCGFALMPLQ